MAKILVVEDEILLLENIRDMLELENYEVITALNGELALHQLREHPLDLVLCDIMMPVMNGYDLLRQMRRDSHLAAIPLIFVTAKGAKQEILEGIKMGAEDYIVKPFTYEDMIIRIQAVLERRALLKAATSRESGYDIFLSYSRKDIDAMHRLCATLRDAKLKVWTDEEGLEPGTRSWRRAIQEAIDQTRCLVVILSPDAKQSEWVEAELDYAEAQGKTIFPVLVQGDRSNAAPFGYTLAQWIDVAQNNYDAETKKLITAINKLIHKV